MPRKDGKPTYAELTERLRVSKRAIYLLKQECDVGRKNLKEKPVDLNKLKAAAEQDLRIMDGKQKKAPAKPKVKSDVLDFLK